MITPLLIAGVLCYVLLVAIQCRPRTVTLDPQPGRRRQHCFIECREVVQRSFCSWDCYLNEELNRLPLNTRRYR
jgi:hypothetical protein